MGGGVNPDIPPGPAGSTSAPERSPAPATVAVCTACRAADGESRPGVAFAAALAGLLAGDDAVCVSEADCLAVCRRAVTLALSGPGRWTYVIGDLTDPQEAAAFARAYGATETGIVAWRDRPPAFRKGVIARVPPPEMPLPASKDSAP